MGGSLLSLPESGEPHTSLCVPSPLALEVLGEQCHPRRSLEALARVSCDVGLHVLELREECGVLSAPGVLLSPRDAA